MTDTPRLCLEEQATSWSLLDRAHNSDSPEECTEARQALVERYEPLARRYLAVALKTMPSRQRQEVIDDLAQEFSVKCLRGAFSRATPERGPFRRYLGRAIQNLVFDHYRQLQFRPESLGEYDPANEEEFKNNYREDLVQRALKALAEYDRKTGKELYRVLRMKMEYPDLDSAALSEEMTRELGRGVTAVWVRKQLHLARKKLWELIEAEVQGSLPNPTEEQVREELAELDLLRYRPRSLGAEYTGGVRCPVV